MSYTYDAPTRTVLITFDGPLDTGASPVLSTLRYSNGSDSFTAIAASFDSPTVLRFVHQAFGSTPAPPEGVTYTAATPWLLGDNGAAVDAFTLTP